MSNKIEIIAFTLFSILMLICAERAVHNWGAVRVAEARV